MRSWLSLLFSLLIPGIAMAQGPEIILDPVYFGDPIHTVLAQVLTKNIYMTG